jgi:hypothetical protein
MRTILFTIMIIFIVLTAMLNAATADSNLPFIDKEFTSGKKVSFERRSHSGGSAVGYKKYLEREFNEQYYHAAIVKYLSWLKIDKHNVNALYNLSCCYAMLNEPELAAYYVKLSYTNGFKNLKHIERSKKFKLVRNNEVFKSTIDSLKTLNTPKNR